MPDTGPILLIDGNNVFMQMWHAFHSTTSTGKSAGGIVGFLTALSRYTEDMNPSKVYVAWENSKSKFRCSIFPEYKQNRKRHPEDVQHDRTEQLLCLIGILKHTPICQLYLPECEGDDIIAYMCNKFPNKKKIIISTDKDYFQLLDENTTIYAPIRKTHISAEDVRKRYDILASNFALFKALSGDSSDNIAGVKGIGQKTIVKLFPDISSREISVSDIREQCSLNLGKSKMYNRILEEFDNVEKFWSIIQLQATILTDAQIGHIDNIIEQHNKKINYHALLETVSKEGLSFNHERLLQTMTNLCA